jgi:hypothetical protein
MTKLINQQEYIRMMTLQEQLNEILKNPSSVQDNKQVFIEYTSLLSRSLFRVKLQEKERSCMICGSVIGSVATILDCKHCICSQKCIESLISDQLEGNLTKYDILHCKCGKKISTKITRRAFGGDEIFFKLLSEVSKKYEPKLSCPICGVELPVSDFITLECDHRYCKDCISMSIEILIKEGNVGNEINCPECQKIVDPHIILGLIDESTREKYDDFLLRSLDAKSGERYVRCKGSPGINCKFSQFISVDREIFECPVCNAKFCPKCNNDPHPKLNCEQKKNLVALSDPYIKEQIEQGVMKICPWCSIPVMKDEACKYVTCATDVCSGKNFFCWDCGSKLLTKHQVHDCVTKDVISNRIKGFFKKLVFW